MSYKSSPFKMVPKSPLMKALKGNQGSLPEGLKAAIEAAPESPADMMDSPAKSLEIVPRKNKDKTLNSKFLKGNQDDSNRALVKPGFGVKKPKVNIK